VTEAAARTDDPAARSERGLRERRCLASGAVRDDGDLVRFVVSPDGMVVPDVAAKLPGRGLWVSADAKSLENAIARNAFAKAAKRKVSVPGDLAEIVVRQLVVRLQGDLGMARKAGNIVLGFDSVMRAFDTRQPPALLVEASDGSDDGRRKLIGAARIRDVPLDVIAPLTSEEMSLALGRGNVIHAALKPGPLAERLKVDAGRLSGFRPVKIALAGPIPVPDERAE
jgi:predicted RNA-binding protein YlxR (DUF448 family)